MSSTTEERAILDQIKSTLSPECLKASEIVRERRLFVYIQKECLTEAVTFLHSKGFTHLSTITGQELDEEIELIYHLIREGIHIGVRTKLPLDNLNIPTITQIIPGASLYEREIYDILGVRFEGHPNLTRLILPDAWDQRVPPLRKQQPSEKQPLDVTPRRKRSSAPPRTGRKK